MKKYLIKLIKDVEKLKFRFKELERKVDQVIGVIALTGQEDEEKETGVRKIGFQLIDIENDLYDEDED